MRHKKADDEADMESLTIVEHDASKVATLERGVERGRIMAEQANFSRDLANEPANYLTPTELADRAEEMAAETGLECEIYGPDWMKQKGMGGLLGVAAGQRAGAALHRPALQRRAGAERPGAGRQGHHLRHRRHLDQAGRRTWAR